MKLFHIEFLFWIGYRQGRYSIGNFARDAKRLTVGVAGRTSRVLVLARSEEELRLEIDGHAESRAVAQAGDQAWISGRGGKSHAVEAEPRFPDRSHSHQVGAAVAPMPGKIVLVAVKVGDRVRRGDTLVVLEAMKMEHPVRAPEDGVVAALPVRAGQQVEAEAVLAVVTADG